MAANGNHGDRHVTVFEEQEGISATVDQIESTLTIASKLLETPAEELGVMPPSRNIVIRSPSGLFLKSYGSPESFDAERDNLVEFHTINNARSKAQNHNIPGIEDDQYIRIPFINPNLDNTSRI